MPQQRHTHTLTQRGFTLIEIAVVILIISLVASIAVVMFSRFNEKQNLQSKAEKMVSILRYCHRYAMFNQTRVQFILTRNGYTLKRQSSDNLFYPWQPFSESNEQFSYLNFHWKTTDDTNQNKRLNVNFYPDGSVSAPLTVPFTVQLYLGENNTGIAIALSSQGAISLKRKGQPIAM